LSTFEVDCPISLAKIGLELRNQYVLDIGQAQSTRWGWRKIKISYVLLGASSLTVLSKTGYYAHIH